MRRLTCLLLLLIPALTCRAEKDLPSPDFTPGSGFEMKLTAAYESIPPAGFFPVRVKMTNSSGSTRQWQIRARNRLSTQRMMTSVERIEVPAGATKTFDLLFALAAETDSSPTFSSLDFTISGPEVTQGSSYMSDSGTGKIPTAFLGLGEALSVVNWGPLQSLLEKDYSKGLQGTPLDMAFMPTDWRALAGFQLIVLTGEEWRGLPPECREALSDWIVQGGELILAGGTIQDAADLPPAGSSGMGMVEHWTDTESLPAKLAKKLTGFQHTTPVSAGSNHGVGWPLVGKVGTASSPGLQILCFVVVFAIVIGPVNFLVFAPAGRRHRLFWTIPALSLLASLLMGAYILLQEGIGGWGMRYTVRLSLPAAHKLATWQEQVSRTGVLVGSNFSLPDTSIPVPIPLAGNDNTFTYDAGIWSGDWFKSRTTQAQLIVDVSANRERIEVSSAGGEVSITSSFATTLPEIWYIDESDNIWHGTNIRPGETAPMKSGTLGDFHAWKNHNLKDATPRLQDMMETGYGAARGRFFATQEANSGINSLPSIRWKDAGGLLFGEALKKP